jgi:hypothetical protein
MRPSGAYKQEKREKKQCGAGSERDPHLLLPEIDYLGFGEAFGPSARHFETPQVCFVNQKIREILSLTRRAAQHRGRLMKGRLGVCFPSHTSFMPRKHPLMRFVLVPALLLLAACNQSSAPPSAAAQGQPQQASLVTPPGFQLPEGQGCSGEIARFRAVQDNDLATGHVNRTVHERIKGEIDQAAATCAAGNDAGARGQLAAVKRRHGYPG